MKIFLYVISGVAGGVIGGMGMGGGTLLIPFLTVLCGLSQHYAQSVNLIVFVPMSIVAIIIHAKNGLINKSCLYVSIPAAAVGILASVLVKDIKSDLLGILFGCFLVALGVYQLASSITDIVKKAKSKKIENKTSNAEK